MAEKYSFFDSTPDDDRNYPADEFALYFRTLFKNGVFLDKNIDALKVTAQGSTMETVLGTGVAYLEGYRYENDAPITFAHAQADQSQDRIDRIIIRLDKDLRTISAYVKQGNIGGSAPSLTRSASIYELCVATVTITAGKSYIDNSQIADERLDVDLCGLASPTHMKRHAQDHAKGGPDEITLDMIGGLGDDFVDTRTEKVTYYVRSNGNDDNDGLTEATAFKTFHKAITSLAKINYGDREINVGAGVSMQHGDIDYRDHEFDGYFGGSITIDFNDAHEFASTFRNMQTVLTLQNFTRYDPNVSNGLAKGIGFSFYNCQEVWIRNCSVDRSEYESNYAGFSVYNSLFKIQNTSFTDITSVCISADEMSIVVGGGLTGNVLEYGIAFSASQGSVIDILVNSITGTTLKEEESGGQVFGV